MSSEWYASRCGIPHSNTKNLLTKLRRGESILPKNHYKRKSRVLPFQHLVMRSITIDPTTPLRTIREDLVTVVARHGDDVATIPENAIDAVVEERTRRARETRNGQPEEDRDDMLEEQSENAEQGSETVEVDQGEGTVPSISALNRFLRGLTGRDSGRNIPVISFKKCTVRGPDANTQENKIKRLEAIQQLGDKLGAGYRWVCIDETSWRVGNTTAYGWAKRGDRCFVTKSKGGIALTPSPRSTHTVSVTAT